MFLNKTVELSLDDYETYVEPILTEFHTDILEYYSIFCKKCSEENENILRKEIYSLFRLVCSFILNLSDQKSPFLPMMDMRDRDSGRLSDIPTKGA